MTESSKTYIYTILREKYPLQAAAEAVMASPGYQHLVAGASSTAPVGAGTALSDSRMAGFNALKAQLEKMSPSELARLAAESEVRQRAAHQAKLKADAAAKEAARFYNRPEAMADFAYWCKVEFWTLDEAAVLLLGRNPHVVTPEALAAELSRSTGLLGLGGPPPKAAFHIAHERLRTLMLRAEALASPRLKPGDVVAWAISSGAAEVPSPLLELAGSVPAQPKAKAYAAETDARRVSKRTEDELAEMRRYKEEHGTKATAEKYGLSGTRIRKLFPTAAEAPTAVKGLEKWTRHQR